MLITGAETDSGGDSLVWMKPNISRNSSLGLCNMLFQGLHTEDGSLPTRFPTDFVPFTHTSLSWPIQVHVLKPVFILCINSELLIN